jgi:hypothetical protein
MVERKRILAAAYVASIRAPTDIRSLARSPTNHAERRGVPAGRRSRYWPASPRTALTRRRRRAARSRLGAAAAGRDLPGRRGIDPGVTRDIQAGEDAEQRNMLDAGERDMLATQPKLIKRDFTVSAEPAASAAQRTHE